MEFCETEKCGIYNFTFDAEPVEDAIICVNHDSPVLTTVKKCRLKSFHQTLKPRIVNGIRCTALAFGIRLTRVIHRQLRHISRSLDSHDHSLKTTIH